MQYINPVTASDSHRVLVHALQTVLLGICNSAVGMQMYETIRKELAEGGRTYIICPLVEESSSEIMTDVKAAEEEHRRLQQDGVLGDVGCGLLHGRMSSEDKFAALQAFAAGQTPVLISTTVVEVRIVSCHI